MYHLPPEIQLDICKCLNFNQIFSIQQTNRFYNNFVKEYKDELARKKFNKIRNVDIYKGSLSSYKFFKPELEFYGFELSEELEEKWKSEIKKSIPMFLNTVHRGIYIVACGVEESHKYGQELFLPFPNIPKNIKEMKLARYLFEQLFNCVYEYADFSSIIFNPQMIQLLFDENKTKIPLQIHSQKTNLYINKIGSNFEFLYFQLNLFIFILDHLISSELIVNIYQSTDTELRRTNLFELLTNRGDKFSNVLFNHPSFELYKLVLQHIETSKDLSKMVKEIRLNNVSMISKKVSNLLYNKYNPTINFSIITEEVSKFCFNVKIKRIN